MLRSTFFLVKGVNEFSRGGYLKAERNFDPSVMARDLRGQHVMVTGANQGLGYQTSVELAKRGAVLYMALTPMYAVQVCRNEQRGLEAADKVRQATGNEDVHLKVCDVSSLAAIRALAEDYLSDPSRPLHLLVNNAGVMLHEAKSSGDGYEINFATNTLGSYALTRALEPALKRAAAQVAQAGAAAPNGSSSGGEEGSTAAVPTAARRSKAAAAVPVAARVVFVASGGQYTERLVVDDLQMEKAKKFDATQQYARDKRRQVALAEALAARWAAEGAGILAVSMHPGWAETDGVRTSIPGFYNMFKNRLRNLEQGCDTIVWLALQDADKLEPGAFYLDRQPQAKHLPLGGTKYTTAQVDALVEKLEAMAAPALTS